MKPIFLRKEKRIPFTREGYDKVLEEKKTLSSERPDAVENLRKAREMGDLSENGYYKASRAKLSSIDARLRHLDRLIRLGTVVESSGTGVVDIGSTVVISDGTVERTFTIVGGYESNPENRTISHVSPIGRALLGHREGDTVTVTVPKGTVGYTIRKVQ